MVKILLSTGSTHGQLNALETQEMALDLGYDGVEVMADKALVAALELEPKMIESFSAVEAVHTSLLAPGGRRYLPNVLDAIRLAKKFGAKRVIAHPHSKRWFLGGQAAQAKAANSLLQVAREQETEVCVEVLPKPHGSWFPYLKTWVQQPFNNPRDWARYIVRHNLSACLDTTHLATWGSEVLVEELLETVGAKIIHMHLSDYCDITGKEHLVPGTGTYAPILRYILAGVVEINPLVCITVEIVPSKSKASTVRKLMACIDWLISCDLGK